MVKTIIFFKLLPIENFLLINKRECLLSLNGIIEMQDRLAKFVNNVITLIQTVS